MINLDPQICRQIKEARRTAGLSQSALAREVGCKQSALSMFEQGDGTKLNDEAIGKLCTKFGIKIDAAAERSEGVSVNLPTIDDGLPKRGYCPNPLCPGHHHYEVEGRQLLRPDRVAQDPVGGKYCALCGEIIEKVCPNCGSPVHEGAICSFCGQAYVAI